MTPEQLTEARKIAAISPPGGGVALLVAQIDAQAAEIERLRQALRDIADPIAAWRRDLQPGCTLDGRMCAHMANDQETYKRMAREALRA